MIIFAEADGSTIKRDFIMVKEQITCRLPAYLMDETRELIGEGRPFQSQSDLLIAALSDYLVRRKIRATVQSELREYLLSDEGKLIIHEAVDIEVNHRFFTSVKDK